MTKTVTLQRKIKAEIEANNVQNEDRFERYKRMLAAGTAASFYVIRAADGGDNIADIAIRQHIAELIDTGRTDEMTTQLRAYAVRHLVSPTERK